MKLMCEGVGGGVQDSFAGVAGKKPNRMRPNGGAGGGSEGIFLVAFLLHCIVLLT